MPLPTHPILRAVAWLSVAFLIPGCSSSDSRAEAALGEYQSVTSANGTVYVGWGDTRNSITEPVNALDPISGQTHAQQDVLFQKIKVQ